MSSINDKIERGRKPRVHIKYEVETDGAIVERELPFVVGVLGDFSGNPTEPLAPLSDRRFVTIDKEHFDEVMSKIVPELHIKVPNTLANDGSDMRVDLAFHSMDDFEPGRIAEAVPALKELIEARSRLRDLMTKADRSASLEDLLEKVLTNKEDFSRLAAELGIEQKEGPSK